MEGFAMNSNILALFPPIIFIFDPALYPLSRLQSINNESETLSYQSVL